MGLWGGAVSFLRAFDGVSMRFRGFRVESFEVEALEFWKFKGCRD